jgi:hypothetical protein
MTAIELVEAIESAGGTLVLHGNKIRIRVPEDAAVLIDSLRAQRAGVVAVLRQRSDGPPWPGYNGGKQFCCAQCGTRFDTSTGFARHQVNGCGASF